MHSDIHTVHSPTAAHLLELRLKFTLKLDGYYMFRSTSVIRELAIEPGQIKGIMLPHHRITNNDVTLLNVLISI